jgi:exosortase A-associated hydrolase 2
MTGGRESWSLAPVFIDGPAGRLFAVHYRPPNATDTGADLIYVPPFAEEMNCSRRMAALQARSFAAAGIGVVVLDLFGTGDSAGEFVDARWGVWRDDLSAAASWLESRGRRTLGLWGLRLGGLLAAEVASRHPTQFRRLLLWQPVTEGKAMLTQFLRIRVAAGLSGEGRESTEGLRAELSGGRSAEIAGYDLAPELAAAIDAARLDAFDLAGVERVDWLDVTAEAGAALPPGRQRFVDRWRDGGVAISARSVAGEPFWTIQETTLAPELLAATLPSFAT